MLSPMGVRGSSDAYGSWKMICIRRRYGLRLLLLSRVMSVPSNTMVPDVGSISRSSRRPTVVLPDPDSPTRPSVSPRRTSNDTPDTAWTTSTARFRNAAADREVLDEIAHLDQRPLRAGRRVRPRNGGHASGHAAPPSAAPAGAASAPTTASSASIVSRVPCSPSCGSGFIAPVPSWYSQQRTSCPDP